MNSGFRFKIGARGTNPLPFLALGIMTVLLALEWPQVIGVVGAIALLYSRFLPVLNNTPSPVFRTFSRWKLVGVLLGTSLFASIIAHADPALAQLFGDAESEATGIFGAYIDQSIIAFLFGLMRVVVWVASVGFVFFAVYQAQRGEQWQPLLQNAFIVIAAVVVVEGLGALFFGDGGST